MTTVSQRIEVAEDLSVVRGIWSRFVRWARVGQGRLACNYLVCVDAVRSGLVDFASSPGGQTIVTFRMDDAMQPLSLNDLRRALEHDLVVFKDYVERSRLVQRVHTVTERKALASDADRRGDKPRHLQPSSEGETTFWHSHFPR